MTKIIEMIKSNKKVQIALVAVVLGIIAIIVAINLIGNSANVVKLEDYVKFSDVKGCDGYGYIDYEIDSKALSKVLLEDDEIDDDLVDAIKAGFIAELIDVDIEDNGKLSNGDKIEIEVTIDDDYDYGKKIVDYTFTKKISGLGKVKTLNLFKDFAEVKFEGRNGKGTVKFEAKKSYKEEIFSDIYGEISYYSETEKNLTNGQKITVKATISDTEEVNKKLMEKGYKVLEEQTMEFTVENLWEPITRNQLTDDMFKAMEKHILENPAVESIASVYYFWGDTIEGSGEKTKNAVFAYVDYVNKKGQYKKTCFSFKDLHIVTEEGEEPFDDAGVSFTMSFTKYEKTTQQEALERVTKQLGKWYNISSIK